MAKPENVFINAVHRHMPPHDAVHREGMHNVYRGGTADMWYSARGGRDLWVEYKFIVVPKRPATVIDLVAGKSPDLSALQQEWLRSRYEEGRNVWVIVGCKEGGVIYEHLDWEKPWAASEFREHLLSRQEVAASISKFLFAR